MSCHVMNVRCVERSSRRSSRAVGGFTLLEVLVAVTITLILMGLVVEIFSRIGQGVNNSRANMELNDQLRHAKHRLIMDLRGVTAPMAPPLDPFMNLGYFEYVEGPRVATTQVSGVLGVSGGDMGMDIGAAVGNIRAVNSAIGDTDDILMFTTSSFDTEMFVGRGGTRPTSSSIAIGIQSRYAEVAWFLRRSPFALTSLSGGQPEFFTLHRRTWLILPDGNSFGGRTYADVDISMSAAGGSYGATEMPPNVSLRPKDVRRVTPTANFNSLGDLTRRECRSVHQPYKWPYEMMYVVGSNQFWNTSVLDWNRFQYLSLPTLSEQSHGNFPGPIYEKSNAAGADQPYYPRNAVSPGLGPPDIVFPNAINTTDYHPPLSEGPRIGEDVILNNVVSFDVKAWDPGAPVFAAPAADGNSTSTTVPQIASVLVPGDPGYISAIQAFINSSKDKNFQPVGFGAYADLNYMGIDTVPDQARQRWAAYGGAGGGALADMNKEAPYSNQSRLPLPAFAHPGEGSLSGIPIVSKNSKTAAFPAPKPCVYDTWSTHYEYDGINNDPMDDGDIDELTNGIDDNGNGLIDEPNAYNDDRDPNNRVITGEQDAPPPYRSPLRGIKITIRVVEQDSKQVREVTVVQEFVPL